MTKCGSERVLPIRILQLACSLDGKKFLPVGEILHMDLGYPWTANRFALLNYSETQKGVGGIADFNWFRFYNK